MLDFIPLAIFIDANQFFDWFINNANYLFVFIFMTIESSFIPFPSELVVPPAAYLACSDYGVGAGMNVYMVVVMATLGALAGAFINYYLALWIGRPLVYRFADSRFGHACLIDRGKVERAENYFDSHGAVSTFVGRLIPAVRQLISIPAGISRMNVMVFAVFTSLGALVWNSVLALLGYLLAKTVSPADLFEKVEEYNRYLTWAGYGLALVCVIFILWNAFKPRKHRAQDSHCGNDK